MSGVAVRWLQIRKRIVKKKTSTNYGTIGPIFVHRLGLDLLFAGKAEVALLLLALTTGPLIELDVSNFCCMVCTWDAEELCFPLEAMLAPTGLEVLTLGLVDVVALLELTLVVELLFAVERKAEPVTEGFVSLGTLLPAPLLTGAPDCFDAALSFEFGNFALAVALPS